MGESSLSVVCLTGEEVGALDIRFSYCSILLSDGVFAAKISGRWRFSDLISYFCILVSGKKSQKFFENIEV